MGDRVTIRCVLVVAVAGVTAYLRPFGWSRAEAAVTGAIVAGAIILFEMRLSRASLKRLIGAAVGSILGIAGASLISLVIHSSGFDPRTAAFLSVTALVVMGYVGLIVGADKGDLLNLAALGGLFSGERSRRSGKLLDTSAIIDGRIADVALNGFLDGVVLVPRFVLRELQLVADSADAAKRNRGRRGLDVLRQLQSVPSLEVRIIEDECPHLRQVDEKLVEMAKLHDSKIVTNDFNLNKLAGLQRVAVLNINELANALKPAVLPGETLRVFVLKEGKEHNQGIAYLDDGTMVVIDNARKMVAKTIAAVVTSVLQTAAGKMIFARYDLARGDAWPPAAPAGADEEIGRPRESEAAGGAGRGA